MNKILKHILISIIIAIVIYLGFAFVIYDLNPEHWGEETRVQFMLLLLIFQIFIPFIIEYL